MRRLLQAAHIVSDVEPEGVAAVRNGIALSAIHHSAFDAHLLGITPDGLIQVSDRLMALTDGPTLEYSLKGMNGSRMVYPQHERYRPDRDLLAQRFEAFKAVN